MKLNKETFKVAFEALTENLEGELYFKEVNNKKWFDITFDGKYVAMSNLRRRSNIVVHLMLTTSNSLNQST